MPSEPKKIRTTACWIRSELTTAPIELSLACSAIGPNSATRPRAMSPISPVVGTSPADPGIGCRRGARGRRGGRGRGRRRGGRWRGRGRDRRSRATRRRPRGATVRRRDGAAVAAPLAPGLPLGAVVPVGAGVGSSRRSRPVRRMSKKPRPVRVTVTSSWPELGEDPADILRGDVRVLEPDRPLRAAGVVDRELEARRAVRERRQQDEDQAGDRDERREDEEPAALADDVKHSAPRDGGRCAWSGGR